MRKIKKAAYTALILAMAIGIAGCSGKEEEGNDKALNNQITNGGFEEGTLSGWTTEGNAFQRAGVIGEEMVEGYAAGKSGEHFFSGLEAGPQSFMGSMRSEDFKVDGTGHIAFLMGAGKETEKCYIGVYDAETDEELARQANTAFDGTFVTTQMMRYTLDLSGHIGKTVYIKAVDEDNGDSFAYLLLDDFVTYMQDDSALAAFTAEAGEKRALLLPPAFTEDETMTTIQNPGFEEADLAGWKILSGTAFNMAAAASTADLFWDVRSFDAVGSGFLNGYDNEESAVGELRSSKFTLAGDGFISFLLGGAGTDSCFITIHDGRTDEELFKITDTQFKDPEMALNLSRVYVDASEHLGKVLYIKITDAAEGGPFGAITVDDFLVSMTEEAVVQQMLDTYTWAAGLGEDSISAYIKNYYQTYAYPFELPVLRITERAAGRAVYVNSSVNVLEYIKDVKGICGTAEDITIGVESVVNGENTITEAFETVDMSAAGSYVVHYYAEYGGQKVQDSFTVYAAEENELLNGGFESGSLAGWEVLTPDKMKAAEAVVSDTVFWNEGIPFNKSGNYLFSGWGAQYDEADAYAVKSSEFTLSGSGYISFKMGGNAAAVKVYKSGGELIATYLNTEFADVNFPNIDEGSRLATMTTFAADLSQYIGEKLYIELHDTGAAAWGVAFYDEVKVYYETVPDISTMSDFVTFNKKVLEELTPAEFHIPWVLAVEAE